MVEIDVSAIEDPERLHELLSAKLNFPDYYGHNWDAFDECIADPEIELPQRVLVRGLSALVRTLPRDAALLRKCASGSEAIPAFEWIP